MLIENLLSDIKIVEKRNEIENLEIKDICYDSRTAGPGQIFVAIKGYLVDGHKYIQNAVEKGCVAVIVEEFNAEITVPQYKVDNSRAALAYVSCAFFEYPSKELIVIGITATNGKTTTSMMLDEMLLASGFKVGLIGTIYYRTGDKDIPAVLTTPQSYDIQKMFREMINNNITHVIMEVSSSAIETLRVLGIDFNLVAMNNISHEHIDQHGSFENYYKLKKSLITDAPKTAWKVLNSDDPYVETIIPQLDSKTISFGLNPRADIIGKNVDVSTGQAKYTLEISKNISTEWSEIGAGNSLIELSVLGLHSVFNSLSALTIALILGVNISIIKNILKSYKGPERRFQLIFDYKFKIIDDHFANIGNIEVTLLTLSKIKHNKLHLVYAIRGNRGIHVNGENVDAIAKFKDILNIDSLIATSYKDVVTINDNVSVSEENIFKDKMLEHSISYELIPSLKDAINSAVNQAKDGDIILLAGCQGMDSGCKYALEAVSDRFCELDKKELFKVWDVRIAGK